uniref:Uncharacterized protein n=1 Tax=Trichogramma kaykai TaxID=54128 RepID=A0ABD2W5Z2_9HYME
MNRAKLRSGQYLVSDFMQTFGFPHLLFFGNDNKEVAKLLLRSGANPTLPNKDGLTPLHIICIREYDDDLVDIFFQFTNKIQHTMQIDAKDNLGRTPLQFAVAHLLPHVVDVLLDHGADLSTFVFSTCFTEELELPEDKNFKLKLASGVLAVTERLVKRGYKLDRDDTLTIMKLFANHGLFVKSTHLEKSIYDDEEFVKKAKKLMMNPSLSLYNLIQLPAKKAATQLTYNDYLKFVRSNKLWELPEEPSQVCAMHLCEIMSRGVFRRWALDCFLKLTRNRLPIEICEMIIDESLMNEDLWRICLAATGQSS